MQILKCDELNGLLLFSWNILDCHNRNMPFVFVYRSENQSIRIGISSSLHTITIQGCHSTAPFFCDLHFTELQIKMLVHLPITNSFNGIDGFFFNKLNFPIISARWADWIENMTGWWSIDDSEKNLNRDSFEYKCACKMSFEVNSNDW